MKFQIAFVQGDGIGPEVMDSALKVLEASLEYHNSIQLNYVKKNMGFELWEKTGEFMKINGIKYGGISQEHLDVYDSTDVMLYSATSGGSFPRDFRTPFPVARRHFNIYANVRPARSYPNVFSIKPGIDLVLIREQTEGLWMGEEYKKGNDVANAVVTISRKATEEVARFAFDLAQQRNQQKMVTCVHKSNVLPLTFGLFVDVCKEVANEFPDCALEEMHTDVLPFELVRNPGRFDVVLTTNMYGDAISGETAAICGGLGIAPSGEYGSDYAIFRPIHGSAPDLKDKNEANPLATILSAGMMMKWLGDKYKSKAANAMGKQIESAVEYVLRKGKVFTPDLGGDSTRTEVTVSIIEALRRV